MGFPLKTLGADLRRNVTIIRLASGKLVVHSTAPFDSEDVRAIRELGEPAWLIDTLLRHDTFAKQGREAFPEIPYLAPLGFTAESGVQTRPILPAPEEWTGELDVLELRGIPKLEEHVVLHKASKTLIVADLLVNFGPNEGLWSEILLNVATVHGDHDPGVTHVFKKGVVDAELFKDSIKELLSWDFDRIIVGHGEIIPTGGREKLHVALCGADLLEG